MNVLSFLLIIIIPYVPISTRLFCGGGELSLALPSHQSCPVLTHRLPAPPCWFFPSFSSSVFHSPLRLQAADWGGRAIQHAVSVGGAFYRAGGMRWQDQ